MMSSTETGHHVTGGASSLFSQAKSQIIRNIDMLEDVGDVPYAILRPILQQIGNPAQLRRIEERSPHIAEHDGEIWLAFIKRDVQNYLKKPHQPSNPKNWWKVYQKLKKEEDEEVEIQKAKLKAALDALNEEKESSATKITDRLIDPSRRKGKPSLYGPLRAASSTKGQGVGGRKLANLTGKDALAQARKQVHEAARQRQLATPTHMLSTVGRKPKVAPKDWMEKMMPKSSLPRAPAPPPKQRIIIAPRRANGTAKDGDSQSSTSSLMAREARLKALQNGNTTSLAPTSSASKVQTTDAPHAASSTPSPPSNQIAASPTPSELEGLRLIARKSRSPSKSPPGLVQKRKKEVSIFMPSKRR